MATEANSSASTKKDVTPNYYKPPEVSQKTMRELKESTDRFLKVHEQMIHRLPRREFKATPGEYELLDPRKNSDTTKRSSRYSYYFRLQAKIKGVFHIWSSTYLREHAMDSGSDIPRSSECTGPSHVTATMKMMRRL